MLNTEALKTEHFSQPHKSRECVCVAGECVRCKAILNHYC